jgi:hypothetical protein
MKRGDMSECFSVNAKIGTIPAILSCPENGTRSKQVDIVTVRALVRTLPLGMPNTQYYFCDAPDCDLVRLKNEAQYRDVTNGGGFLVPGGWRHDGIRPEVHAFMSTSGIPPFASHSRKPFLLNPLQPACP